jgi:hypothetical protein
MARLYVFAEGQTEQTFAGTILSPHLAAHGVYIQGVVLIAHARKKGRTHRGGGRDYGAMKRDIVRFTHQETGSDVFFTTMIDLYALHNDFPGRQESEALRHRPYERVESLEKAWSADVGDTRFVPYIQLHEFEACLFAKPDEFAIFYAREARALKRLEAIAAEYESPELIDDGPATAPSKRILDVFPDYEKAIVGPLVAELIGLDQIRARCPHFHEWLISLESLGSTTAPAH